jgi:hypothetical protein
MPCTARRSKVRVATLEEAVQYGNTLPRGLIPPIMGASGIAIDASTPPFAWSTPTAATLPTLSFTPPQNAILAVILTNTGDSAANVAFTAPTNTGGTVTWNASASVTSYGAGHDPTAAIWLGQVTASAAMTVSGNLASTQSDWGFQVVVVTGAASLASQTGASLGGYSGSSTAGATPLSLVLTPLQGADSLIIGGWANYSNDTLGTPLTGPAQSQIFSTLSTTVASGSNGVNVSTFTGTQTLDVASATGWPSAASSANPQGVLAVATSAGTAYIAYSQTTGTTFTQCETLSGSGTLSTGGSVQAVAASQGAGDGVAAWCQYLTGINLPSGTNADAIGDSAPTTAELAGVALEILAASGGGTTDVTVSATQPQTVAVTNALARAAAPAQAQTVAAVAAVHRSPGANQSQAVTVQRQVLRAARATQAQTATITAVAANGITLTTTQGQSATAKNVLTRTLTAAQAQTLTARAALVRSLAASQGQAVAQALQVGLVSSVMQAQQAQLVLIVLTPGIAVQVSQGQAVTLGLTAGRGLGISQGQSGGARLAVSRTVKPTQGQTASLTAIEATSVTLTVTQGQTVTDKRALTRSLSAIQAQTPTVKATPTRTLAGTQAQTASPTVRVARAATASQTQLASVSYTSSNTLPPPRIHQPTGVQTPSYTSTATTSAYQSTAFTPTYAVAVDTPGYATATDTPDYEADVSTPTVSGGR